MLRLSHSTRNLTKSLPIFRKFSTIPTLFEINGDIYKNGDFHQGNQISVRHSFSQEDVNKFALLCGDKNPLHTDPEYAKNNTIFGGTIVHGILVSSLFSNLFGSCITGSIYVNQNLSFKRPVHVGKKVEAVVEVIRKDYKKKGWLITCSTNVYLLNEETNNEKTLAIQGEASVLVPLSSPIFDKN